MPERQERRASEPGTWRYSTFFSFWTFSRLAWERPSSLPPCSTMSWRSSCWLSSWLSFEQEGFRKLRPSSVSWERWRCSSSWLPQWACGFSLVSGPSSSGSWNWMSWNSDDLVGSQGSGIRVHPQGVGCEGYGDPVVGLKGKVGAVPGATAPMAYKGPVAIPPDSETQAPMPGVQCSSRIRNQGRCSRMEVIQAKPAFVSLLQDPHAGKELGDGAGGVSPPTSLTFP